MLLKWLLINTIRKKIFINWTIKKNNYSFGNLYIVMCFLYKCACFVLLIIRLLQSLLLLSMLLLLLQLLMLFTPCVYLDLTIKGVAATSFPSTTCTISSVLLFWLRAVSSLIAETSGSCVKHRRNTSSRDNPNNSIVYKSSYNGVRINRLDRLTVARSSR